MVVVVVEDGVVGNVVVVGGVVDVATVVDGTTVDTIVVEGGGRSEVVEDVVVVPDMESMSFLFSSAENSTLNSSSCTFMLLWNEEKESRNLFADTRHYKRKTRTYL